MRPDLPWNVAGIPPEAREAARAAARREGLSVGEWLTRRILRSFSDGSGGADEFDSGRNDIWRGGYHDDPPPFRRDTRDTEDMLSRVSRSEADVAAAYKRMEEQMRMVARRLDSTERSQSENNRAMSKAAAEINVATREQAQAFDQLGQSVVGLAERIDRVERSAVSDGLKDAVRALHQGLSRLADQIAQTANQSATQISALADNLEAVAGKVGETRKDTDALTRSLETRVAQIGDRVQAVERAAQANAGGIERAMAGTASISRLEESVSKLETGTASMARLEETVSKLEMRGTDPTIDRRLHGIERALADIAGRMEESERDTSPSSALEESLKDLQLRIDAADKRHRDAVAELRDAVTSASNRIAAVETTPHPVTGGGGISPAFAPPPVQPSFDAPPPFPDNVPPLHATQESYLPPHPPGTFEASTAFPPDAFAATPNLAHDPFSAQAVPSPVAPQGPESFLAAARRSAQAAAAQAEAERQSRGFAGFSWGSAQTAQPTPAQPRSRYALIGVLATLIVLAIGAGVLLNQRLSGPTTHVAGLSALFVNKGDMAQSRPSSSTGEVVQAANQNASALVAPAATIGGNAPSSPALTALKSQAVRQAPIHRLAAAPRDPAPPHVSAAQQVAGPAPTQQASVPPLDRISALANSGNAKAETIVGLRYLDGTGVPVNEPEAAKWLERAADQGEPVAQYRLGTLYERGRGVPADNAKAIRLYQAAAQAGNRKAMHNLAVAYAQGTGTNKDFSEAARWFSKAAALGLADSQFNLAVLYERGLGVPQSLLDAYKWYAIAAAQGDAESKSRIDALSTQLSADDRAAAQRSADMFHPAPLDRNANVPPEAGDLSAG